LGNCALQFNSSRLFFTITSGSIVTQQDIDDELESEPTLQERQAHIIKLEQIQRNFIKKEWVMQHAWLYSLTEKHANPHYGFGNFFIKNKVLQ
jgi:hypothetical protein